MISIRSLLKTYGRLLGLKLIAGREGLDRTIDSCETHRPALALTGFMEVFSISMVQVLGNHEVEYLRDLPKTRRGEALRILFQFELPCVIVTGGGRLPSELKELASQCRVPLLRSENETARFIHLLHFYLDDVFAPQVTLHGTLVDVHGVGLLFSGRSAIGKSEIGLDLVERGHRLVADDTVIVTRKSQGILVGQSPKMLQDHMEIRGIGVVNIKKMFGISGVRPQKRVEVMVGLLDWDHQAEYERVGLEDRIQTILGVEVPLVAIPIFPGKNITVIAETIALHYLLRVDGYHPAREFDTRLIESMKQNRKSRLRDPYRQ